MGRDRVISRRFADIHPRFQTPWLSGVWIAMLALVLMVLLGFSQSVNTVMTNLISAIGVMVSFYYGMAGIACTWYYRKTLSQSLKTFLVQGIWSLGSALVLLAVGAIQLTRLDGSTAASTIGAIAIGLIPMLFYRLKYNSVANAVGNTSRLSRAESRT